MTANSNKQKGLAMQKHSNALAEKAEIRLVAMLTRDVLEETHIACAMARAMQLAKVETLLCSLEASGHARAAAALQDAVFGQPDGDLSVDAIHFARQLLADDYDLDTPELRGESVTEQHTRNGAPKK